MDNEQVKNNSGADSIPTFTPPTQTFTPPKTPVHNGPVCYYHNDEPAVAQCVKYGYAHKSCPAFCNLHRQEKETQPIDLRL